jgi:hypothetical protein
MDKGALRPGKTRKPKKAGSGQREMLVAIPGKGKGKSKGAVKEAKRRPSAQGWVILRDRRQKKTPERVVQIFGARSARSKTGVFSILPRPSPAGVSSAAWRSASVVASSPSNVSLAPLPESCRRAGTCSPVSGVFRSRLFFAIVYSLIGPIYSLAFRSNQHSSDRKPPATWRRGHATLKSV